MEEQKDLLYDEEITKEPATTGLRFANYIIDVIVFYVILFSVVLSGLMYINPDDTLTIYLLVFGVLLGYYTLMEGITGGKTLGKFITKTRAVKEDFSQITFTDAFLRSLCRLIPFEPFSAFGGRPWHDRWTKTMVIKE